MPNVLPPQQSRPRCHPTRPYSDLEAEFAKFTNRRIAPVLRGLTEPEAALALAWAYSADSWTETAAAVGLPSSAGERVRRKLKRLGVRYNERSAEHAFAVAHRPVLAEFKEVLG